MVGVWVCCRVWGMWQGVGHVAGCGACGRGGYVVWGQAYGTDGDMWQGWGMWQGVAACGRMLRLVAGVVVMWQGGGACHKG